MVLSLLGALLPILSAQLHFDMAAAGNLFLATYSALFFGSLAAGPLMDRYGLKLPLAGAGLLVALGLAFIAAAPVYAGLMGAMVLIGFGGGALNIATNGLISDLQTDPAERNAALNLLGVFFGLGALMLPLGVASLLRTLGVSRILLLAMIPCLASLALSLAARFPEPKHGDGFRLEGATRLLRDPMVLLFGCLLFFEQGNEAVVSGYLTSYLTSALAIPIVNASFLLTVYWIAVTIGRLIASRLSRLLHGASLVVGGALGAALGLVVLVLAPNPGTAFAGVAITGLCISVIFQTVLGQAGSRFIAYSGTAFSILFSMAQIGGTLAPWAVGQLATTNGLRNMLVLPVAGFVAVAWLQLRIVRRPA